MNNGKWIIEFNLMTFPVFLGKAGNNRQGREELFLKSITENYES
jgi:hypothetical protein